MKKSKALEEEAVSLLVDAVISALKDMQVFEARDILNGICANPRQGMIVSSLRKEQLDMEREMELANEKELEEIPF